jgi:hypothetical protein
MSSDTRNFAQGTQQDHLIQDAVLIMNKEEIQLRRRTWSLKSSLGAGKVWNFADGKTINFYMEPQYSVWRSGLGAPVWQVFTGINFQFSFHLQFWSKKTGH